MDIGHWELGFYIVFQINSQKGVILYLAIVITSIMLAIALGLSTILFGQIKTIKEMGLSVKAFYFADSAIEYVLYDTFKTGTLLEDWEINCTKDSPCIYSVSGTANDAEIVVQSRGSDCLAPNYCIKSYGEYQGVKRAIEIGF